MEKLSCFSNHLGTPKTIFIHVTCVVPFCAKPDDRVSEYSQTLSNQTVVPNFSPHKNFLKRINKVISPYMWIKRNHQEGLPPTSNKFIRKIGKAIQHVCMKKKQKEDDKCLWRKTILMGEKCQPLQFPGVIFYDNKGKQLSELPRSPGSSPLLASTFFLRKDEIEM